MRIFLVTRPDGVSLLRMVDVPDGDISKLVAAELAKSPLLRDLPFVEIGEADIPQDKTFRDAWVGRSGKIEVDMAKARDVHLDRLRLRRNEKLAELDLETMKGREVQGEKQFLRDLPQTFDLTVYKTPEELKEAWPEELE